MKGMKRLGMWKKGLMKYEEEINEGGIECNDAFQSKEPLIIEDINDIFSLGVEGLKCCVGRRNQLRSAKLGAAMFPGL